MSNFDFNAFWNQGALPGFFKLPFDAGALLETQRKNAQALADAQKLALEGWQSVLQRQSELASQLWQEQSSFAQEFATEGTPEQKATRHVDLARKNFEASVENWEELSDLIAGSNKQASELLAGRVSKSLAEFKSALGGRKAPAAASTSTSARKKAA